MRDLRTDLEALRDEALTKEGDDHGWVDAADLTALLEKHAKAAPGTGDDELPMCRFECGPCRDALGPWHQRGCARWRDGVPAGPDLREQIKTWFANYKGMCETIYGVKDGLVNWPPYRCQAQEVYEQMHAALTGTAPKATEPDLRAMVLAQYEEVSAEYVMTNNPPVAQIVDGRWYVPKWGCDTLEHILDAINPISWTYASASTAATEPKAGEYRCDSCGPDVPTRLCCNICGRPLEGPRIHGSLDERRKGGT